ncbi:MAG: ABC transporter ATP-binding protein [Sulfolobales archaeon]|nr:ABC transporter ATP-binding protein [Sulfolobales archaeon]MCX8186308.1 ABC transporter ATP-binding protein [Sulfolobales archaeon]MDW7968956.1 ABC transporter ATP-binding protein [Sulfolobales archaeon]
MDAEIIKLVNVSKVYVSAGGVQTWALRGVNLVIRRGEFISIMGPSGHGKTTLLYMIGTLEKPTSGKVFIDGYDTTVMSDEELSRLRNKKIGFVFQQYNLINRMTVEENVELPLIKLGLPRSKRKELVEESLLKVGCELSWLKKRPIQLSGGQQQRVAIARALVANPQIILCDEPTGALDSKSAEVVLDILRKLNMLGHTIIMVTHDANVASIAKKILLIRDGNIVGEKII